MERDKMKKQSNVNHDFKYHAEIEYDNEDTYLSLTNAMGNTIEELLIDIKRRFKYYRYRNPKIVRVIKDPNGINIDIANKIFNETNRISNSTRMEQKVSK